MVHEVSDFLLHNRRSLLTRGLESLRHEPLSATDSSVEANMPLTIRSCKRAGKRLATELVSRFLEALRLMTVVLRLPAFEDQLKLGVHYNV
jgi:hypothetical protein